MTNQLIDLMADISNFIFIKGSKQSIVDFINRGLEGSRVKKRVSDSMSGAEIVNRLNDHGYPISMTSYIPMPRTYLTYDTTNTVKDFYSWYVEGMGPYDMIDCHISHARQKELDDFIDSRKDVFGEVLYEIPCYNHAMKLLHPELKDAYRLYRHNYYQAKSYQKHKYGIIGWLDWCRTNYGCTWPAPFDVWRLYKETGDNLCLAIEMNVCALIPDVFLRYMNSIDGLTVYAYGNDNEDYDFWYQFNGQNNEITKKNPWKDRNYKKYRKEFEKTEEDESYQEYSAVGKVMTGYVKDFLKELDESFLENKHK